MEAIQLVESTFKINPTPTLICICHNTNQFKKIESGSIWPIPVRGSKYKIRFSEHSVIYRPLTNEPAVKKDSRNFLQVLLLKRILFD